MVQETRAKGASLKCTYAHVQTLGNELEELEFHLQPQSYNIIAMADGIGCSCNWSAATDGYKPKRKERHGRQEGKGAAFSE